MQELLLGTLRYPIERFKEELIYPSGRMPLHVLIMALFIRLLVEDVDQGCPRRTDNLRVLRPHHYVADYLLNRFDFRVF